MDNMKQLQEIEQSFGIEKAVERHSALQGADEYRGVAEIQAQLVIAQRFPRNEQRCIERIKNAFGRVSLAQQAEFEIPKGGQMVGGETIKALEAIAQLWGNITWEWREVFRDRDYSDVAAYAWDVQSNVRRMVTFRVRHWIDTKKGGRPPKDEREIYELLANMAQRRVRACLKAVIPGDVTEYAIMQARETLRAKFVINDESRRKMLSSFHDLGVSKAQIEKRINRNFESIEQGQWGQLRRIYQSIKDGMIEASEAFEPADINDIRKPKESATDEPVKQQEPKSTEQKQEFQQESKIETIRDEETGEETYFFEGAGYWNRELHSFPPKLTTAGQWRKRRGAAQVDSDTQPPETPPFDAEEEAEIEVKL